MGSTTDRGALAARLHARWFGKYAGQGYHPVPWAESGPVIRADFEGLAAEVEEWMSEQADDDTKARLDKAGPSEPPRPAPAPAGDLSMVARYQAVPGGKRVDARPAPRPVDPGAAGELRVEVLGGEQDYTPAEQRLADPSCPDCGGYGFFSADPESGSRLVDAARRDARGEERDRIVGLLADAFDRVTPGFLEETITAAAGELERVRTEHAQLTTEVAHLRAEADRWLTRAREVEGESDHLREMVAAMESADRETRAVALAALGIGGDPDHCNGLTWDLVRSVADQLERARGERDGLADQVSNLRMAQAERELLGQEAQLEEARAKLPPPCPKPGHTGLTCAGCAAEREDLAYSKGDGDADEVWIPIIDRINKALGIYREHDCTHTHETLAAIEALKARAGAPALPRTDPGDEVAGWDWGTEQRCVREAGDAIGRGAIGASWQTMLRWIGDLRAEHATLSADLERARGERDGWLAALNDANRRHEELVEVSDRWGRERDLALRELEIADRDDAALLTSLRTALGLGEGATGPECVAEAGDQRARLEAGEKMATRLREERDHYRAQVLGLPGAADLPPADSALLVSLLDAELARIGTLAGHVGPAAERVAAIKATRARLQGGGGR